MSDAVDELTGEAGVTETEKVTEPEAPREPCLCGCGETPTRKRSAFMPGHDAKLKGRLYKTIRAGRDNPEATDAEKDEQEKAEARVNQFGWSQPAVPRPKAPRKVKEAADGEAPAEATDEVTDVEDL